MLPWTTHSPVSWNARAVMRYTIAVNASNISHLGHAGEENGGEAGEAANGSLQT
jgi:hypothetical protein